MTNRNYPIGLMLWFALSALGSGQAPKRPTMFRLDSAQGLDIIGGTAEVATYHARRAVHLKAAAGNEMGDVLAILTGTDFKDGTIEIEVAGSPLPNPADPDNRGFIGLEFRVQDHGSHAEIVYLRPTNGRADDQLRRNHSLQYESVPDFPWHRLRKENPGVYESYVDLQSGEWTKMKIVVAGTRAQLYINDAPQPSLIVNDLKLGDSRGQIALWAYGGTDAYFSNLSVR